jgi:hypothetical protein
LLLLELIHLLLLAIMAVTVVLAVMAEFIVAIDVVFAIVVNDAMVRQPLARVAQVARVVVPVVIAQVTQSSRKVLQLKLHQKLQQLQRRRIRRRKRPPNYSLDIQLCQVSPDVHGWRSCKKTGLPQQEVRFFSYIILLALLYDTQKTLFLIFFNDGGRFWSSAKESTRLVNLSILSFRRTFLSSSFRYLFQHIANQINDCICSGIVRDLRWQC